MTARSALRLRKVAASVPLAVALGFCGLSFAFLARASLASIEPAAEVVSTVAITADAVPLAAPDAPQFVADALVTKPLFSVTRAPPAPPPPPAPEPVAAYVPAPPEEAPPAYSLRGIIATPVTRKVLLRREDNAKPVWVAEGERSQEGWLLAHVGVDEVVLSKGSREIAIHLKPKRAKTSQFAFR